MQVQWLIQKKCGKLLDSKVLERIEGKILSLDLNPAKLKQMKDNILKRARTWVLLKKTKRDKVIQL